LDSTPTTDPFWTVVSSESTYVEDAWGSTPEASDDGLWRLPPCLFGRTIEEVAAYYHTQRTITYLEAPAEEAAHRHLSLRLEHRAIYTRPRGHLPKFHRKGY
jgi:hypothetical protein